MDHLLVVKYLHVVSSTILFGTGLGTAYFLWAAHRSGEVAAIANVARLAVRADWLFTAPSGIVQPATGALLIHGLGHDPLAPWLVATYILYVIALLCWLPVVRLQYRMRDLATEALVHGTPLPAAYRRCAWAWFALGWPAFLSLLAVFYLMVARPG
jgi:uncharacterized membrane protein